MNTISTAPNVGDLAAKESTWAWKSTSLQEVLSHVQRAYQIPLKDELPRLAFLLSRVARADGAGYPEIDAASRSFAELSHQLLSYFWREEQVLFPWFRTHLPAPAAGPNDRCTLLVILRAMRTTHDAIRQLLARLSWSTNGYAAPTAAPGTYQVLLYEFCRLDSLTCDYLAEEETYLFPRLETS